MLNFSNFKPVTTANTRDNSHLVHEQSFDFKFKKFYLNVKDKKTGVITKTLTSAFTVSNKKFDELNLGDKNRGLIELVYEGKSYLGIVDNDNAVFLKTNKKNENGVKGKVFKSTLLEKSLSEQGVIDANAVSTTQKLELVLVEGSENAVVGEIQTSGIYEIVKASNTTLTEAEQAEDANADTQEDEVEETATTDAVAPEQPADSAAPVADTDDF